jgi:hypothetical protein
LIACLLPLDRCCTLRKPSIWMREKIAAGINLLRIALTE